MQDFDSAAAWHPETLDLRVTQPMPLDERAPAILLPTADNSLRIECIAGSGCSTRTLYTLLIDSPADRGWQSDPASCYSSKPAISSP